MNEEEKRDGRAAAYLKYVADNEQAREGKVLRTDLHATCQTRTTKGRSSGKGSLVGKADQWSRDDPNRKCSDATMH